MKKRLSLVILSVILCVSALCSVMFMTTASAAGSDEPVATFNLGDDGTASHKDGSAAKTTYTETNNGYTLNIANGSKMYPSSYDAKGNSCIKFGSSSAAGSCSFTVPDDVVLVKIYIAKYKSNKTIVTVNGTEYTLEKNSNDGAYDIITVDTSSNKTVSFTTVSGSPRAMMNTIEFYKASSAPACKHTNTTTTTVDATCTKAGSTTVKCDDCDEQISTEVIPALGHSYGVAVETKAPTCTEKGVSEQKCSVCGDVITGSVPALGHTFVDGKCACGEPDPDACLHTNQTTTTKDATKTEDGSIVITCEDCNKVISTTVIPALGCNVTFVVPNGVVAPSYESGVLEVILPVFDGTLPNGNYKYEYTFVGWAMGSIEDTSSNPELYTAGDRIPLNDDVEFYAVYKYNAGGGGSWELKDLSAITSDDVVVITMTKDTTVYALTNGNGTSKAPAATIITVASNKITSNVADALKWNIVKSGSNLTIHPNGDTSKWLYCNSDNNGVRVGTNANKTFTFDSATEYLKHTDTGRYVGVYTANPDWRCYTTNTGNSNIANQTLGFYVLTASEFFTTNIQTKACEHSYESKVTKDATCTELGVTTYTCSKCGDSYTTADIPLADHHYVEEILNPTCNAYGVITNTCSGCGDTEIEYIAVKNHVYVDGICECGKKQSLAEFTFGENSATPDASEGPNTSDGKDLGANKTYTVVGSDGNEYTHST